MWVQFAFLCILSVSSSFSPSALLLPALYQHILVQHVSPALHPPPTSLRCRLVEACLERTVSTDYLSLPPSLPLFTSVQAGGALLNRLVFSRGITFQRRGLSGTAYRQAVNRESPVPPTLSHDPVLLLSTAVHLAHDLAPSTHTLLGTIWTCIFLRKSHGIQMHFLCLCVCVCVHAQKPCLRILIHMQNIKVVQPHDSLSTEGYCSKFFFPWIMKILR